ncbi:hypothetical protein Ddye_000180 [Dipteronia dyeriana]|uniref:GATA-type domain-containing protein n=1 Tax=Dipteronia dyeriana TaxID=168575 RepID=A0AAD9XL67_9ROSI|nr:hypothetical protein Ddye_000180 [Dipteronia dyeriana]
MHNYCNLQNSLFVNLVTLPPTKKWNSSSPITPDNNNGQQPRRCTHYLSQRTPQWRAGPLGPNTMCNAYGVRYKSRRLLAEYRPAKSPTVVSYLHSNSHKKVMHMRMDVLPSVLK